MICSADARPWNVRQLIGLSSDVKPMGSDIGANSLFLELDTKTLYWFTGVEWAEYGAEGELPDPDDGGDDGDDGK